MSTIPNNAGVMFDMASAQTIAAQTRRLSQKQGGRDPRTPAGPGPQQEWYARLVAENPNKPGNYTWIMQTLLDATFADAQYADNIYQAPGIDGGYSASEVNGTSGIPANTIVKMIGAGYNGTVPNTGSGSGSGYVPPTPNPRFLFVYGGTTQSVVRLTMDGGLDGNAATNTEASWTYTISDVNSGIILAYHVPLYTHRQLCQQTIPASAGMVFRVTTPSNTGVGGSAGINALAAIGSGSGSGSGSGGGPVPNLLRIYSCDEQFPMCLYQGPLGSGSGTGSGSGG